MATKIVLAVEGRPMGRCRVKLISLTISSITNMGNTKFVKFFERKSYSFFQNI